MDKCAFAHHHIARWLTLVALFLSPLGSQGDILEEVCPAGRSVLIANATEGVNPLYDGGALGPWVSLSRDFINAVKRENLPYGTCVCSNLPGHVVTMLMFPRVHSLSYTLYSLFE